MKFFFGPFLSVVTLHLEYPRALLIRIPGKRARVPQIYINLSRLDSLILYDLAWTQNFAEVLKERQHKVFPFKTCTFVRVSRIFKIFVSKKRRNTLALSREFKVVAEPCTETWYFLNLLQKRGWDSHIARMGEINNACRILVEKPK
jgi:hypothetical protein